jgi:hypothetical protein
LQSLLPTKTNPFDTEGEDTTGAPVVKFQMDSAELAELPLEATPLWLKSCRNVIQFPSLEFTAGAEAAEMSKN